MARIQSFLSFSLPSQGAILRLVFHGRTLIVLTLAAVWLYTQFSSTLAINPWALGQIIVCLLLLNIGTRLHIRAGLSRLQVLHVVLVADTLLLSELIYITGGAANPVTVLYIWPIVCAALLCRPLFAWLLTIGIILIYLALFFCYQPLALFSFHPDAPMAFHLIGMWVIFSLSSLLLVGWISSLVEMVRRHEQRLNQAYRRQQENEYWLILGMEAASLAHELSTPINNMLLITEEIRDELALSATAHEDMNLLERQLQECNQALRRLKSKKQVHFQTVALYAELAERLQQWQNLRPDVRYHWWCDGASGTDYHVNMDEGFWSALFNILNNAADASSQTVELETRMLPDWAWQITIRNQQGFLTAAQLASAGLDIIESDKPTGMGLGVRLAHATLSRMHGSLELSNQKNGGVEARITLPLQDRIVGRDESEWM